MAITVCALSSVQWVNATAAAAAAKSAEQRHHVSLSISSVDDAAAAGDLPAQLQLQLRKRIIMETGEDDYRTQNKK